VPSVPAVAKPFGATVVQGSRACHLQAIEGSADHLRGLWAAVAVGGIGALASMASCIASISQRLTPAAPVASAPAPAPVHELTVNIGSGVVEEAPRQRNAEVAEAPLGVLAAGSGRTGEKSQSEQWIPEKPFSNQKVPPCLSAAYEVEINGGCWTGILDALAGSDERSPRGLPQIREVRPSGPTPRTRLFCVRGQCKPLILKTPVFRFQHWESDRERAEGLARSPHPRAGGAVRRGRGARRERRRSLAPARRAPPCATAGSASRSQWSRPTWSARAAVERPRTRTGPAGHARDAQVVRATEWRRPIRQNRGRLPVTPGLMVARKLALALLALRPCQRGRLLAVPSSMA
jgi:hypothetical protein